MSGDQFLNTHSSVLIGRWVSVPWVRVLMLFVQGQKGEGSKAGRELSILTAWWMELSLSLLVLPRAYAVSSLMAAD